MRDQELVPFCELPDYERLVEEAAREWITRGKPKFPPSAYTNKPMFTTHVFLKGILMILAGESDEP